ncbi:hypothetical protein BHE74_00057644 [Ensete ventricosum]|nr:hypothetical protein BHE74_00057644 [Ensete ventricosum]
MSSYHLKLGPRFAISYRTSISISCQYGTELYRVSQFFIGPVRTERYNTIFQTLVRTIVCNFDIYRPVHTGPPGCRYADRPLPSSSARYRAVPPKIDRRRSIEGRNRLPTVD